MFLILLVVLLAASGVTVYFFMREDKVKESKHVEYQVRIGQLEGELGRKNKEKEDFAAQLKNEFGFKEQQFNVQLEEAKKQVSQAQENLNKAVGDKQALENKISELEANFSKIKKELELSTEMYDGLKVQYNDLERDMEKMQQAAMSKDPTAK